jgi:hypothetical protein
MLSFNLHEVVEKWLWSTLHPIEPLARYVQNVQEAHDTIPLGRPKIPICPSQAIRTPYYDTLPWDIIIPQ